MAKLHHALEVIGKPVSQGVNVTVYFGATGVTPQGAPIFPARSGKVVRVDDDSLVMQVGAETIALSWDHIVGMKVLAK